MNNGYMKKSISWYQLYKRIGKQTLHICNTEAIRKEFKRAIDYFRRNKEAEHWDNWSGNLFIMVDKYSKDESYEIIISKDFYNMAIPFEKKDYE